MKETFPESSGRTRPDPLIDKLWRWFIAPSPKITEPDQRRQASLLSGFLIGAILLAIVTELLTIDSWVEELHRLSSNHCYCYFYGDNLWISRTQRVRVAAILGHRCISRGLFHWVE